MGDLEIQATINIRNDNHNDSFCCLGLYCQSIGFTNKPIEQNYIFHTKNMIAGSLKREKDIRMNVYDYGM